MPINWKERGRQTGKLLNRRVQQMEVRALTGKYRSDGSLTLVGDDAHGDRLDAQQIYVRVLGNANDTRVVWAANIGRAANLWVVIKQTAEGEWEVLRLVSKDTAATHGEQAGDFASPASTGARPDLIAGRSLMPGRLRLWTAGTLTVNADAFWYLDSAGDRKLWTPTAGNSLNLTSNVPAAVSGIAQRRYVALDFNPDAASPALVATDGTAQSIAIPYDESDIEDITLAEGYLPIGAVNLFTGDTALIEDRITNTRFHVGGGGTGTGSGSYFLLPVYDSDGNVVRNIGGDPVLTRYYE